MEVGSLKKECKEDVFAVLGGWLCVDDRLGEDVGKMKEDCGG
jgi:hypothetical protein